VVIGLVASASAVDRVQLDQRIENLTAKFKALQAKSDKAIPRRRCAMLRELSCWIESREALSLGIKAEAAWPWSAIGDGEWSAPGFPARARSKPGFQAGRQQSSLLSFWMNRSLTKALSDPTYELTPIHDRGRRG